MNVLCAGGDAAPAAPAHAAGGGAGGAGAAWVGDVKRIYLDQTRPATHIHTKK